MAEATMIGIGIAGFALAAIANVVGMVWKLRGIEVSVRQDMDAALEMVEKNTGESITAIRTKIHEVETWARDTFVRRDDFGLAITSIGKAIDGFRNDLKELRDHIDDKIERLKER